MIDPKKELFKWGPIDAKPIYVDYFMEPIVRFTGVFVAPWPDVLALMKEEKVIAICDYEKLRDHGEKLFVTHILPKKEREKWYAYWGTIIKDMDNVQARITKEGLQQKNAVSLFNQWHELYLKFWIYGFLPEMANWGGEALLKRKILSQHKDQFFEIFEAITAPEALSFFQVAECELFMIKGILSKSEQEKALQRYQQQYFWLHNSYHGSQILPVSFFRKELNKITSKKAKEKITEIDRYTHEINQRKQEIINAYKVSKEIQEIGKQLSFSIWWQDLRKKYNLLGHHYIDVFMRYAGKVHGIPFEELCYYTCQEFFDVMNKGKKHDVHERFSVFLEHFIEGEGIRYYTGEEAEQLTRPYFTTDIDKTITQFQGLPVSRGKAKGMVKILHTPKSLEKMKKGNILVAPMTSPDYIVAMRKAVAIITDEGGMTSHAAIVSRELKVPCIVGTRIATKILYDGDIVEVDAESGVIRILERTKERKP